MRVAAFLVLGLVFGSFVTVLVHRLPGRESIVRPGSRCPRCGTPIRARDNVPVLSYLLLRGRCRACGERISAEYPLTEAVTAGLFAAAAALVEPLYAAALVAPFLGIMVAVGLIDARFRIIPNRLIYPSLAIFAVAIVLGDLGSAGVDATRAGIGFVVYALPLFLIAMLLPMGMGMGDVKLAALIGLVLGSLGLRYVAVAAGVGILAGGLGAVGALTLLRMGRKQEIPFGPYLAGGGVVAALVGAPIASLYLSFVP